MIYSEKNKNLKVGYGNNVFSDIDILINVYKKPLCVCDYDKYNLLLCKTDDKPDVCVITMIDNDLLSIDLAYKVSKMKKSKMDLDELNKQIDSFFILVYDYNSLIKSAKSRKKLSIFRRFKFVKFFDRLKVILYNNITNNDQLKDYILFIEQQKDIKNIQTVKNIVAFYKKQLRQITDDDTILKRVDILEEKIFSL